MTWLTSRLTTDVQHHHQNLVEHQLNVRRALEVIFVRILLVCKTTLDNSVGRTERIKRADAAATTDGQVAVASLCPATQFTAGTMLLTKE